MYYNYLFYFKIKIFVYHKNEFIFRFCSQRTEIKNLNNIPFKIQLKGGCYFLQYFLSSLVIN